MKRRQLLQAGLAIGGAQVLALQSLWAAAASLPAKTQVIVIGGGYGGTAAAISGMRRSSEIMPAPLGMAETRPMASAPCATAARASATDWMQQILMRGRDDTEQS